jgi:hypothetical protein
MKCFQYKNKFYFEYDDGETVAGWPATNSSIPEEYMEYFQNRKQVGNIVDVVRGKMDGKGSVSFSQEENNA